ncbi:MAG: hypothetical protein AB1Z98_26875 [Nannocystaceae bacterium]
MGDSTHPFQTVFPGREARDTTEYLEDVARVLELPRSVRDELLELYRKVGDDQSDEIDHDIEPLRRAGLRWVDIYQAVRALQWFADQLGEGGAQWLNHSLDGDTDPKRSAVIQELVHGVTVTVTGSGRSLEARAARQRAEDGVMPAFIDITATEELRGIFAGMDDERSPELIGFLPVASIRIDLDLGNPESMSFQAGVSDIDDMIKTLKRVRKNLRVIANRARAVEGDE